MCHHGLAFEEKRIALFMKTTDEQLKPYNSNFKVPVLQDGDLLVWDSLAILEHLSEHHLDGKGWPLSLPARTLARSMSAEMHSSFGALRSELPMNCRKVFHGIKLSDDAQKDIERIQWLWRASREQFGAKGPWLFGEYTIADAMFAPVALRFAGYSIALDETSQRYVQTVLDHPSIQAWMAAGREEVEIIEEDEINL